MGKTLCPPTPSTPARQLPLALESDTDKKQGLTSANLHQSIIHGLREVFSSQTKMHQSCAQSNRYALRSPNHTTADTTIIAPTSCIPAMACPRTPHANTNANTGSTFITAA